MLEYEGTKEGRAVLVDALHGRWLGRGRVWEVRRERSGGGRVWMRYVVFFFFFFWDLEVTWDDFFFLFRLLPA